MTGIDSSGSVDTDFDVLIVGGGIAGLYALHRMRGLGLTARVFEAGSGIGGTWFWNRYPGCRCDVESLEYSYSFSPELEQEWEWPERYGGQPVILRYLEYVADRFDLCRDVQLDTRICAAHYDGAANQWTLETDAGAYVTGRFCIMAVGNLSTPQVPDFPGLSDFQGSWYHTGMWPHEGVDFSGQRVGVIGTGSSGVQMIPQIAEQAKHLHVFQRTANFILPARNAPMEPERERAHKETYRERRRAAYDTPFGISGYPPPDTSALEASSEERESIYSKQWSTGGNIAFLYCYKDLLLDEEANETAAEFVRNQIRATVKDAAVAELLCPTDHPIGTKRLILDTHYFETFNRDNVTLVDVRSAPIERITATGIRTADADYTLDAIAFATGFDAMTGAMKEIDIRTDRGADIRETWKHGPSTMLGIMVPGFPNLFTVTGPGSPGVKSNMMVSIEQHVDFIADCLDHLREHSYTRIAPEDDAATAWDRHVMEVADATLYPRANSWYMGANIPGKPRIFMPYIAGVHRYKRICDEIAANGYEGFTLTP
jgi:cyclohexanone monooxygenase